MYLYGYHDFYERYFPLMEVLPLVRKLPWTLLSHHVWIIKDHPMTAPEIHIHVLQGGPELVFHDTIVLAVILYLFLFHILLFTPLVLNPL